MVLSDVGHGDLLGRVAIIPESNRFVLNQRVALLRINDDTNPYFLFSIINSHQDYFKKMGAGSSQLNISRGAVEDFVIDSPWLEEQQRIGQFFKSLDTLITLHQRKFETLKKLKKGFLQKMFPKNGESVPDLAGNGLNWNDIANDGKKECILYGNLYTDYGMIADKVIYKTNAEINKPVYSEFGDVLIPASDTTPTGLARATSIEKSGVLLGGDINIIRPNKGINGSCLSLAFNANKNELIRLIKGTTVRHIHNSDIRDIIISLPKDENEQVKISMYFKQLDNLITLHQRKLDILKKLKQGMLQQMFI